MILVSSSPYQFCKMEPGLEWFGGVVIPDSFSGEQGLEKV